MKKPRLSLGLNKEKETGNKAPRLGIKKDSTNDVIGTRSTASVAAEGIGQLIKTVFFFAVFGIILLGVLYSALSATLMFTAPHNDSATERVWVARGAFPGGIVPEGAHIYGSASDVASSSLFDRAAEGYVGVNDHFVAKTIAGPYAEVDTDAKGFVTIDGKKTAQKFTVKKQLLNKSYLAICEDGSCVKGDVIIVPAANIVGEAKGIIDITKFNFNGYEDSLTPGVTDAK